MSLSRNDSTLQDMIYYYHKNMMAYHNNMENLIHLMDNPSSRRLRSPPSVSTRTARSNPRQEQTRSFFTFIPLNTRTSSSSSTSTTLTPLQIENAIETIPYTEDLEETRCPISFEDFVLGENIKRIKGCGHYYKSTGLMNWLRQSSQCPVCRYDLNEYRSDTEPSPLEESTSRETRRTEISQFLESIIQNLDNDIANTFDFSNNEIMAEYSIDLR